MANLKQTLLEFKDKYTSSIKAGDPVEIPAIKEDFVKQIQIISGRNRVFLWVNITMLLIVFVGSIFLVYNYRNDLNKLTLIFSISGISLAGMIYYMTYLWRQIVGVDLAIAMADRLEPSALLAIINSLLTKVT